jgi:hypothetical protein
MFAQVRGSLPSIPFEAHADVSPPYSIAVEPRGIRSDSPQSANPETGVRGPKPYCTATVTFSVSWLEAPLAVTM